MRKVLWLIGSLTAIAAVCAGVLAAVNKVTEGPIADMRVKQADAAARAVLPACVAEVAPLDGVDGAFVGRDAAGKAAGYAVPGRDGGGYGGDIVLMVGFEADRRTVVCYRKLEANETPGLGSKLSTPEFAGQFRGKDAAKGLAVRKDGGEIEAITSATITSRAVCRALADAQAKLAALP